MRWALIIWLTLAVVVGATFGAVSAQAACNGGWNNWGFLFSTSCQTPSPDCGGWDSCELDVCFGDWCGAGWLKYCTGYCGLLPGCWGVC